MRDDAEFIASVPDFITLCESRTNRRLRVREMVDSETMVPASNVCTLPTDYIDALRVAASTDPISVLTPISLDRAQDQFNFTSGYPNHYVITGSTLTAYPLSDSNIVLTYFAAVPALSNINPTNWLLTKAPEIYLYGSLIESAPFMEDDNRLATWISLYKGAVDELQQADTRAVWGKTVGRIRGPTP
jgi:hypothetical protein